MGNACTLALATVAALASLAGCDAEPGDERVAAARSAIEGGSPDVRDTGVVGVTLTDLRRGTVRTCSGSLLAPNLVLTAQHCVADTDALVDCATSVFGPPAAPELLSVTSSQEMWGADTPWAGVAAVSVPPGAPALCGRDVALVILAAPLDQRVTPLAPRLDDAVKPDELYDAVGYGVSGGRARDGGVRRRRDGLHVVCVGDACGSGQIDGGEWRGDHGICSGDSGGPALDEAGGVIGVTSRGAKGCNHPVYGGLGAHAGWIRAEARRAAGLGAYVEPAWARDPSEPAEPAAADQGAGGCSSAPRPETEIGASGGALLAALTALARRRRCKMAAHEADPPCPSGPAPDPRRVR